MLREHENGSTPEKAEASAKILAIQIEGTSEIIPYPFLENSDDEFSAYIKEQKKDLSGIKPKDFTEEDFIALEVLSGRVIMPIVVMKKGKKIKGYRIAEFNGRLPMEWFQFVEDHPELVEDFEKNKEKFDAIKEYFELRFEQLQTTKVEEENKVVKRIREFSNNLDIAYKEKGYDDDDIDDEFQIYFDKITETFKKNQR